MKRLKDRIAIITGGANGIGRATVWRFASEGARVAIWDTDESAGKELQAEVQAGGGLACFQRVDVSDPACLERAVQEVLDAWKRIDILVNNAGILRDAQLIKYKDGQVQGGMSVDAFDDVIGVNLRGVFLCTRAVTPVMIRQEYGRILSTASVVALYGNFGQTNYVAAKAGLIGMTRVWARELGRYNITANAVAPGFIDTEMTRSMPEEVLKMMAARVPLRRMGNSDDIANAFLFLASDEASYISGAVLSVDGGMVVGT
jgi:3-oxoacyl-[acyl-carrier protein] reductase